jgi:hypothetical protein
LHTQVWTEFKVIKETSALTFMVAGIIKEVLTGGWVGEGGQGPAGMPVVCWAKCVQVWWPSEEAASGSEYPEGQACLCVLQLYKAGSLEDICFL